MLCKQLVGRTCRDEWPQCGFKPTTMFLLTQREKRSKNEAVEKTRIEKNQTYILYRNCVIGELWDCVQERDVHMLKGWQESERKLDRCPPMSLDRKTLEAAGAGWHHGVVVAGFSSCCDWVFFDCVLSSSHSTFLLVSVDLWDAIFLAGGVSWLLFPLSLLHRRTNKNGNKAPQQQQQPKTYQKQQSTTVTANHNNDNHKPQQQRY